MLEKKVISDVYVKLVGSGLLLFWFRDYQVLSVLSPLIFSP